VTAPIDSPADIGARRAAEYLQLVAAGCADDAEALLAGLTDTRELVFVGAALTAQGRRTGRTLPTAMRAQASTRQVQLGQLRDRSRRDVEGLRRWLREAGAEVLLVTGLAETARARLGGPSAG
jgi:ethanolamine utilization protein EutP (predicted NTPase)